MMHPLLFSSVLDLSDNLGRVPRRKRVRAFRLPASRQAGIMLCKIGVPVEDDVQVAHHVDGKPFMPQYYTEYDISFSHSDTLLATAISRMPHYCGIDIETDKAKALRTVERFTSVEERSLLTSSNLEYEDAAAAAWCIKEALYKIIRPVDGDLVSRVRIIEITDDCKRIKAAYIPDGSHGFQKAGVADFQITVEHNFVCACGCLLPEESKPDSDNLMTNKQDTI